MKLTYLTTLHEYEHSVQDWVEDVILKKLRFGDDFIEKNTGCFNALDSFLKGGGGGRIK